MVDKSLHPTDRKTTPATGSRERLNDALNVVIAAKAKAKAKIEEILHRLHFLSGAQFNAEPDEIGWCEVGTLRHYALHLREIIDSAFREGECAE